MPATHHLTGQSTVFDEQSARTRWFYSSRLGPKQRRPGALIARASAQRRRMALEQRLLVTLATGGPGSVNWTPLGPSVVANGEASGDPAVNGRITALAVGPGASRVYAGAANGGVWFSSDSGTSWVPLDDYSTSPGFLSGMEADSLSVGALAVKFGASAADDAIFVGTGEPQTGYDVPLGDGYFGIGVRFSASGGAPGSWALEATNLAGHGFFKIIIDPDDASLVYAATSHGLYQRPDGGDFTTWNQVTGPFKNVNGAISDLIVAGAGAGKCYYAAFWGDGVYGSADGVTWTPLSGVSGAGRIALAAGENDPQVIYALGDNGSLYRLDSGSGGSFQLVRGVPHALFFSTYLSVSQGRYDIVLAVDPADANTVYLGGDLTWDGEWSLSLYKGTLRGGSGRYTFPFKSVNDVFSNQQGIADSSHVPRDTTWIGRGIHADAHAFAFATNADGTHDGTSVWVGTDGGLFHSASSGSGGSFVSRGSGMAVAEMNYIAQRADTDAVMFGGCQDGGTLRFWGEPAWFESPKGDGGGVAIDPNNPYRVMRQYTRARLYSCTDGGASGNWLDLAQKFLPVTADTPAQQSAASIEGDGNHCAFYGPIAVTPAGVAPTLAAFGTHRLWLTPDWGNSWVTLPTGTNPYAPAAPDLTQDQLDGSPIRAIAFASASLVFAATQNQVWRFDQTDSGWTSTAITTANLPPNRVITALAVEDQSAGSFYIALGGSGHNHVWHFEGSVWQSAGLAASTLDAPAHAVVVDPANTQTVYLGTDVGCWRGTKTGATSWTWTLFSQGLPESAITDLAIHARARLLRAATHGRGVWEIRLDDTSGADPDIYLRANYADTGRLQGGARFPWVDGAQDPTTPGSSVDHSMSADIKVRRGSRAAGLPPLSTPPNYLDFATSIGDVIDPTTRIETADASGTNQVFLQVHNRGFTAVPGSQVQVLLLVADASTDLPVLPNEYAAHINQADTATTWLANTGWAFADPTVPYRHLSGGLDVRTPQLVEYDIDFSALSLPAGHNRVCAAAFVTTTIAAEQLSSTATDLHQLTMQEKHVAFRILLLV